LSARFIPSAQARGPKTGDLGRKNIGGFWREFLSKGASPPARIFARLRDHLTDYAGGSNERVLGLSALDEFIAQLGERGRSPPR